MIKEKKHLFHHPKSEALDSDSHLSCIRTFIPKRDQGRRQLSAHSCLVLGKHHKAYDLCAGAINIIFMEGQGMKEDANATEPLPDSGISVAQETTRRGPVGLHLPTQPRPLRLLTLLSSFFIVTRSRDFKE